MGPPNSFVSFLIDWSKKWEYFEILDCLHIILPTKNSPIMMLQQIMQQNPSLFKNWILMYLQPHWITFLGVQCHGQEEWTRTESKYQDPSLQGTVSGKMSLVCRSCSDVARPFAEISSSPSTLFLFFVLEYKFSIEFMCLQTSSISESTSNIFCTSANMYLSAPPPHIGDPLSLTSSNNYPTTSLRDFLDCFQNSNSATVLKSTHETALHRLHWFH